MVDNWRPIETAPKRNDTYLLLSNGQNPPTIAFWNGKFWDDGDFRSSMPDSDFTHWQPLPKPPVQP